LPIIINLSSFNYNRLWISQATVDSLTQHRTSSSCLALIWRVFLTEIQPSILKPTV